MKKLSYEKCPLCNQSELITVQSFDNPPKGETAFKSINNEHYKRDILQCLCCGHFLASHEIDLSKIYNEDYLSSNYRNIEGILSTYERIMHLPHKESDNSLRVERLLDFAQKHFRSNQCLDLLDIGSGLCVFIGKIVSLTNWKCTAVEPDGRYCEHAKNTLNIEVASEDYRSLYWQKKFDIISLNKVLEHFEDPTSVLSKCATELKPGGLIYIELPDGECASKDKIGFNRQEFFIDHYHAFSMASIEQLVRKSGLRSLCLERVREPSKKYTLRGFLSHFE